MTQPQHIVALSGGIGGAKLALGFYQLLGADRLTVVCNVGDDFTHLGFHISPDVDTVIYTLAGVANRETGWGRAGETWQFMSALKALGGEDWFNLGDLDLATHVLRTQRLNEGLVLSEVCDELAQSFSVSATIVPVTDQPVPTRVLTAKESVAFQHYFVRDQCAPVVTGFEFQDAAFAQPAPGVLDALHHPDTAAIVVCPSNPFISIDPMLAVPGLREALRAARAPVIAVSPIIDGQAVKGPTAKMMSELNLDVSAVTVAKHYADFLNGYIVDDRDVQVVKALDLPVITAPILMRDDGDKQQLASTVLSFAQTLTSD